MIGKMFNGVLSMIRWIIWFQRKTVVTHSVAAMFTEASISRARNLAVMGTPILVYIIFYSRFPRPSGSVRVTISGWLRSGHRGVV